MRQPNFDSKEEMHIWWYLMELYEYGFIDFVQYHPEPFLLSEKQFIPEYKMIQKTKRKEVWSHVAAVFINQHVYTADFKIVWTSIGADFFVNRYDEEDKKKPFWGKIINDEIVSYIDVKGSFSGPNNSSAITFPLNQKWVFDKHGVYVQKVIPVYGQRKGVRTLYKGLFVDTFTPERYLYCDEKDNRARGIKYEPIKAGDYIELITRKEAATQTA